MAIATARAELASIVFRYGFDLEPTVVENIRTKMMVADPVAANYVRLMSEMYVEPDTYFGDITRYFEEQDIKTYGKSLTRAYLSHLLRNPSMHRPTWKCMSSSKVRVRWLITPPPSQEQAAVISIRVGM